MNTVGGFTAGPPVHETPLEDWDAMLAMNLRTAFLVSRAIAPLLIRSGGGAIVHVSGRAGLTGFAGGAGYCAAKAGVIRLTETLSAELKEHGVNVNCILPGTIDTPSNRAARPDADFSRWVAPEALGEVIMFLCSPTARHPRRGNPRVRTVVATEGFEMQGRINYWGNQRVLAGRERPLGGIFDDCDAGAGERPCAAGAARAIPCVAGGGGRADFHDR